MAKQNSICRVEAAGIKYNLPATQYLVLYKYFGPPVGKDSFVEENLKNLITGNQLRLTSNAEVNDPTDISPKILRDFTKAEMEQSFVRFLEKSGKQFQNRSQRKKYLKENYERYVAHSVNTTKKAITMTGFTCFTEKWNNRLMWAHYAQSHKGVCIGFRTRPRLQEIVVPLAGNCLPVRYGQLRPEMSVKEVMQATLGTERIKNVVLSKDEVWSYEKEWRYLSQIHPKAKLSEGGLKVNLGSNEIVEIIFGLRSNDETEAKIYDMIAKSEKSPKFYRTNFEEGSYELQRALIANRKTPTASPSQ